MAIKNGYFYQRVLIDISMNVHTVDRFSPLHHRKSCLTFVQTIVADISGAQLAHTEGKILAYFITSVARVEYEGVFSSFWRI